MARSRRAQVVPLTQTGKKTSRDTKNAFIETVATALSSHSHAFLFRVGNFRTAFFQNFRQAIKDLDADAAVDGEDAQSAEEDEGPNFDGQKTRIFVGKNSLMQRAMAENPHDAIRTDLAAMVAGPSVGLLCTSKLSRAQVLECLSQHSGERDFARAGMIATEEVVIPGNPGKPLSQLYDPDVAISTVCEAQLKFSGMSRVERSPAGHLVLCEPYCICREGDRLTVEQAKLLRIFGVQMAAFVIEPIAYCDLLSGRIEPLASSAE